MKSPPWFGPSTYGTEQAGRINRQAALALSLLLAMSLSAGLQAAEPFAGQRELLQRQLTAAPGQDVATASALAAVRLSGDGSGPEVLLLGTESRSGALLSPQSRFELGSISKAMTGSLLARMVSQGRLGLDDPVERWMPSLAGTPAGRLTLRSLATHRSGLPRLPMSLRFLSSMLRDPGDPYRHYTEADMLAWLREWGGEDKPVFAYSNLGFGLLGLVLERAAGQPLARLMETEILRPAGAGGAGLDESLAAEQFQGHDERGRPTPAWTIGPFAGAGALRADAQQMLALLDAARQRRAPFDAGAEHEQARRHETGAVGLGWMRTEKQGDRIVWHNGGTGGFRSFLGYSEVSGRGVLLMANGQLNMDSLGMHLINPSFPQAAEPPPSSRVGASIWAGAVIALITLGSLAWHARRPRSKFEQAVEVIAGAALLAFSWRLAAWASVGVAAAAGALALLLGGALLWRGRAQPAWPASRRRAFLVLLNAVAGLLVVAWLW
jgi:CubicO group peptidase (beta-lactamase class C family)